jgi:hypothetical protein
MGGDGQIRQSRGVLQHLGERLPCPRAKTAEDTKDHIVDVLEQVTRSLDIWGHDDLCALAIWRRSSKNPGSKRPSCDCNIQTVIELAEPFLSKENE